MSKKNYKKSLRWYLKSAMQGNIDAQYSVGWQYANGEGVQKNYIIAYAWFNLALANSTNEKFIKGVQEDIANLEAKMRPEDIAEAQNIDPIKILKSMSSKKNRDSDIIGSATAFFINKYTLVTNNHAIKRCSNIDVKNSIYSGSVKVVYADKINDIAILKVSKPNNSFLSLRAKPIEVGDDVAVLGYPLGSTLGGEVKFTLGNVSSLTGIEDDITTLQHTAPIQPGNSGGPLLDHSGNVVGIVASRLKKEHNVNFAIKVDILKMQLKLRDIDFTENSFIKSIFIKSIKMPQVLKNSKNAVVKLICR